ncbi:hypothetical protein [Vibrio alfacsensis]|uniref:hypothetical protein n=1 Tax=Vibrio alfacsensis TaxID=1074311 RepID=UPI0040689F68
MTIPDLSAEQVESFAAGSETEVNKSQEKNKPIETKPKAPEPKLVKRDTFSFPVDDHAIIADLITKFAKRGIVLNKSEVVRAGLHVLNAMNASGLREAAGAIDKVKVDRPTSVE